MANETELTKQTSCERQKEHLDANEQSTRRHTIGGDSSHGNCGQLPGFPNAVTIETVKVALKGEEWHLSSSSLFHNRRAHLKPPCHALTPTNHAGSPAMPMATQSRFP